MFEHQKLAAIESLARMYSHPGVNIGAARLAGQIVEIIEQSGKQACPNEAAKSEASSGTTSEAKTESKPSRQNRHRFLDATEDSLQ
jgi:hypothetical protein